MKSPYFCAHHAKKVVDDEPYAYASWAEMMQRGLQAYVQCRADMTERYFGAALDIAFIRASCKHNKFFVSDQLIKPGEFLLAFKSAVEDDDAASELISRFHGLIARQKARPKGSPSNNICFEALKVFCNKQKSTLLTSQQVDNSQRHRKCDLATATLQ